MPESPGWRDVARATAYPFADDAPRRSADGWTLPDGLIVDARLNVPAATAAVFLATLTPSGPLLSGAVRRTAPGLPAAAAPLGTFSLPVDGITDRAELIDAAGITRGTLLFDPASVRELPVRPAATFVPAAAPFLDSTVLRYPPAALTVLGAATGRITLRAARGIRLVAEPAVMPATGFTTIRVDAVGAPADLSDCFGPLGEPILTVNTQFPDAGGDFRFEPDDHAEPGDARDLRQTLKVEPLTHGLRFRLAREAV